MYLWCSCKTWNVALKKDFSPLATLRYVWWLRNSGSWGPLSSSMVAGEFWEFTCLKVVQVKKPCLKWCVKRRNQLSPELLSFFSVHPPFRLSTLLSPLRPVSPASLLHMFNFHALAGKASLWSYPCWSQGWKTVFSPVLTFCGLYTSWFTACSSFFAALVWIRNSCLFCSDNRGGREVRICSKSL